MLEFASEDGRAAKSSCSFFMFLCYIVHIVGLLVYGDRGSSEYLNIQSYIQTNQRCGFGVVCLTIRLPLQPSVRPDTWLNFDIFSCLVH